MIGMQAYLRAPGAGSPQGRGAACWNRHSCILAINQPIFLADNHPLFGCLTGRVSDNKPFSLAPDELSLGQHDDDQGVDPALDAHGTHVCRNQLAAVWQLNRTEVCESDFLAPER